jgi:hypothetical protein
MTRSESAVAHPSWKRQRLFPGRTSERANASSLSAARKTADEPAQTGTASDFTGGLFAFGLALELTGASQQKWLLLIHMLINSKCI